LDAGPSISLTTASNSGTGNHVLPFQNCSYCGFGFHGDWSRSSGGAARAAFAGGLNDTSIDVGGGSGGQQRFQRAGGDVGAISFALVQAEPFRYP